MIQLASSILDSTRLAAQLTVVMCSSLSIIRRMAPLLYVLPLGTLASEHISSERNAQSPRFFTVRLQRNGRLSVLIV